MRSKANGQRPQIGGTAPPEPREPVWWRTVHWLGIHLRQGEGRAAILLFACFFLLITFQYATKSVRQSTFISTLGAEKLPYVFLLVALFSYPLLVLYSRLVDRLPRHLLSAATSGAIGASMVLFWWLYQFPWEWVPVAFYVWASIMYVMIVSQFWSLANHLFDARQAKRLFGFIGAGGLLGGIAGGQVARLATGLVGTRYALLVGAAILVLSAGLMVWIYRLHPARTAAAPSPAGVANRETARGGFEAILRSRHLRLISSVMILTVMVAQVVDVQFNWAIQRAIPGLDARTAFFGNVYSIMGISAFLFQLVFTSRLHRVGGVGFSLRVLPVTMGIGTIALFLAAVTMPQLLLAAALVLKIGENGLRYSLDQATRELLFLPVPATARSKAKAFIDVFVQRGAKGLAALLLLPVTFGVMTAVEAGWISLALIVVWLVVTVVAYREYVQSFRRGLQRRAMDAEVPINVDDVTTLQLLLEALGSPDAPQVLHSLDLLAAHGRGRLVPPLLLYHDDPRVRQRTLEVLRQVRRRDAAPLVARRLGDADPQVRAEAVHALAKLEGKDACALMLPRLDEGDPGVRAAAIACLANLGGEEHRRLAEEALDDMLTEGDPAVRAESANAIGAITGPRFDAQLVRLLGDGDVRVVRQAIAAVRRRVGREGYNPIYVATLVALLRDRRLKHEAREALAALGEDAIPALLHFMSDPDEPLWVRRALPKTLARIETPDTAKALLEVVPRGGDFFLRRKLIEALAALRPNLGDEGRQRVEGEIAREAETYLTGLADLVALGLASKGRLDGAVVTWDGAELEASLVDRLLAERMEDCVENMFNLLALLLPPEHVRAAHRSLLGRRPELRSHALEYLDNAPASAVRRHLLAALDDAPVAEKLERAAQLYGIAPPGALGALGKLLAPGGAAGDAEGAFSVAALYVVYSERVQQLYPAIERLSTQETRPLVAETAAWVTGRLDRGPAAPEAGR